MEGLEKDTSRNNTGFDPSSSCTNGKDIHSGKKAEGLGGFPFLLQSPPGTPPPPPPLLKDPPALKIRSWEGCNAREEGERFMH